MCVGMGMCVLAWACVYWHGHVCIAMGMYVHRPRKGAQTHKSTRHGIRCGMCMHAQG